jgi:hypothetical protein
MGSARAASIECDEYDSGREPPGGILASFGGARLDRSESFAGRTSFGPDVPGARSDPVYGLVGQFEALLGKQPGAGIDDRRVVSGSPVFDQLVYRGLDAEARPIRPVGKHGFHRIGDGDDLASIRMAEPGRPRG